MSRFGFEKTDIEGLFLFTRHPVQDERGSFERLFCPEEFDGGPANFSLCQLSLSRNLQAGTLRGMHFQKQPHDEAKLVQVVSGVVYDVVADIRKESSTFGQWQGFELSSVNGHGLVVPSGCAHGFLTLADSTSVLYGMDRLYQPGFADGFRYDDPLFAIDWPIEPSFMSKADESWANLDDRKSESLSKSGALKL